MSPPAREMVSCILRANGWSEEQLAREVGVTQPTVSRWLAGDAHPNPTHLATLTIFYYAARKRLVGAGLMHTQFQYVCSFAPRYTKALVDNANEALRTALWDEGAPFQRAAGPGIAIDFFVRAASLGGGATAHTFVDNLERPRTFVVLVDCSLSEEQQYRIAWDEAIAHVLGRLACEAAPVQHPRPILRHGNQGGKS